MAYYDALISAWNSATQPPAGVTGTPLTGGMTTQQKIDAVNAWTVAGASARALVAPSDVLNAIVPADLNGLTQLQVLQFSLLMSGALVDASPGTTIRLAVQNLFAGKTLTLANLAALVAPFDAQKPTWWKANGYLSPFVLADATNAGLV